ncbi:MAG TPA: F-box/WD40 repeat-containing protein [Rhabdochlamydiaceae bacterium]
MFNPVSSPTLAPAAQPQREVAAATLADSQPDSLLSCLPHEKLLAALSYLHPRDIRATALTCRALHTVAQTGYLWKHLFFRMFPSAPRPQTDAEYFEAFKKQYHISSNIAHGMYRLQTHDVEYGTNMSSLIIVGDEIIGGAFDPRIRILDLQTCESKRFLEGRMRSTVSSVAIDNKGRLFSDDHEGGICVWDLKSGAPIHTLLGHERGKAITALAFECGRLFSGADTTIKMWDVDKLECLRTFAGHAQGISAVAVANGKLVSASFDRTVRVWNLETGACLYVIPEQKYSFCVSNGLLITANSDNTIGFRDLETGHLLKTPLQGHNGMILAFAVAEGKLFSASEDQTVKVWDIETGQCLYTFKGLKQTVRWLAFVAGKLYLGSSHMVGGNWIRTWDFDVSDDEVLADISRLLRNHEGAHTDAVQRFLRMPIKVRHEVYTAFAVAANAEDAFLRSTPLEKAQAIENYLNPAARDAEALLKRLKLGSGA